MELSRSSILVTSITAIIEVAGVKASGLSIDFNLWTMIPHLSSISSILWAVSRFWSAIQSLILIRIFVIKLLAELATNMLLSESQSNAYSMWSEWWQNRRNSYENITRLHNQSPICSSKNNISSFLDCALSCLQLKKKESRGPPVATLFWDPCIGFTHDLVSWSFPFS